eukprot:COSAG04_NODE_1099_length_8265_cov_7.395053_2_plen_57_part_00
MLSEQELSQAMTLSELGLCDKQQATGMFVACRKNLEGSAHCLLGGQVAVPIPPLEL